MGVTRASVSLAVNAERGEYLERMAKNCGVRASSDERDNEIMLRLAGDASYHQAEIECKSLREVVYRIDNVTEVFADDGGDDLSGWATIRNAEDN